MAGIALRASSDRNLSTLQVPLPLLLLTPDKSGGFGINSVGFCAWEPCRWGPRLDTLLATRDLDVNPSWFSRGSGACWIILSFVTAGVCHRAGFKIPVLVDCINPS